MSFNVSKTLHKLLASVSTTMQNSYKLDCNGSLYLDLVAHDEKLSIAYACQRQETCNHQKLSILKETRQRK